MNILRLGISYLYNQTSYIILEKILFILKNLILIKIYLYMKHKNCIQQFIFQQKIFLKLIFIFLLLIFYI